MHDATHPPPARRRPGAAELATIITKVKEKYGFFTSITKVLGTIGGIVKGNRIPDADRGVVVTLPSGS